VVKVGLLFCIVVSAAQLAVCQVSGTISGRVDDATGAAITEASITVKNLETGATRVVSSDGTGNFKVFSLPVGTYEVKAEKAGFQSLVRTPIQVAVAQEAVVHLKLEVGTITQ